MSAGGTEHLARAFARALAFQRETVVRQADRTTEIPEGWVIRSPSLPGVWALNQVRINQPLGFAAAVAVADRHLAELPFRQLCVEDEATGARLEPEFRAAGWRVECEVTMVLAGEPDRTVDTSAVIEPGVEEVLGVMVRWTHEDESQSTEAEDDLVRHWRREWRARDVRLTGVRGRSGALAAITLTYSDGVVAQVEDVYTVPEERGRGFARALVTHAVGLARQAGPELTFIVADDYGWPKELYGRIGFAPAGRTWSFHRAVR